MKNNDLEVEQALQQLASFLTQLDWPAELYTKNCLKTHYKGDYGLSPVLIKAEDRIISLTVEPILEKNEKLWGDSVISLIKTMSREISHVEVGISDKGELFAKVHIPIEHLNLERFQCLLIGVCQVAENIMIPIMQANAFDNLNAQC